MAFVAAPATMVAVDATIVEPRPDDLTHLDPPADQVSEVAEAEDGVVDEPRDGEADWFDDDAQMPSRWERLLLRSPEEWITFAIVTFATYFVFHQLNPNGLIFEDNVPTGGDMGAHVWGPAFLRDHLLPDWRLSGWTTDWYAGFPAYQFYFVVPALFVVALNVGLEPFPAVLCVLSALGAVWLSYRDDRLARWRPWVIGVASIIVVLSIGIPYGVAFKLVAVSGVVALPAAAYTLGRFAGLPFPGPALLSLGSLFFVFDTSFNIYGGNAASTMAGEFSFAISLSFALFYLALLIRGIETGRGRGPAALLLGLTALCHVIPLVFAVGATAVIVFLHLSWRRLWYLVSVAGVGGLLSAFWLVPFFLRHDYLNNMGWEKINRYRDYLWTRENLNPTFLQDYPPLEWVIAVAIAGFVVSVVLRRRLGIVLGICATGLAVAFQALPEGRLWNARILPFYYLCLYLLAAVAISELTRGLAWAVRRAGPRSDPDIARRVVSLSGPIVALGLVWLAVGLPMGAVPFADRNAEGHFEFAGIDAQHNNFVPGWARWNFSGIEGKANPDQYPEFYGFATTMARVGAEHGCGQSMWEFSGELSRYGSTMVPMLLPHFTDGCIGSMEGLFFEASATVPYHFLVQSELSGPSLDPESDGTFVGGPSRPMRNLPYGDFDIDLGVSHLQMLGVRYYMAFSETAVDAAARHLDLTEVAVTGPWHVYQVADSALVVPLANEPAVIEGVDDHQSEWNEVAVPWFLDRSRWTVPFTQRGPAEWQRIGVADEGIDGEIDSRLDVPAVRPLPDVVVSGISVDNDTIEFDVDRVGVPVLVRMSYFPNWDVAGADGPYRVAPNLMVVIPTENHVELSYGRTWVDWAGLALTAGGIVLLVMLFRRPFRVGGPGVDVVGYGDELASMLRASKESRAAARAAATAELAPGTVELCGAEPEAVDPEAAEPEAVDAENLRQ